MTRVVYVLLALNLALLTWNLHTRAAPEAPAAQQLSDSDNQLPLLSELSEDALRPRRSTGATPNATIATDETASASAVSASADPGAKATAQAQSTAKPVVDSGTPQSPSAQPAVETVTAPDATAPTPRICLTLGPLDANSPVQAMREWLEQAGAQVEVRTDERREVALYWVYFPPRASRDQAQAEVARLLSEGLSDVIAVPKGDMANAISLGVFSRTESRDRRLKQMNDRGYQPSVAPRYRVKLATWIDANALPDTLSDEQILARWPGVDVGRKPCGARTATGKASAVETIAARQAASYNTTSNAARRYHFSGAAAPGASDGAQATR